MIKNSFIPNWKKGILAGNCSFVVVVVKFIYRFILIVINKDLFQIPYANTATSQADNRPSRTLGSEHRREKIDTGKSPPA